MIEKNMKTLTIRGTTYEIVDEKSRTNTPDWNQNDPTSMTYVQNRPFYSTDPVETTIVEEQTLEGFSEGTYQINATNIELIEGQTYDVVWDGTTYSDLVCYIVEGFNAIGAHFKKNSGFDFTTCPFVIIYISSYQALMIQTDSTETSHTIKIISAISEVIQLPEKYISYKPGIKTTGTIYAITAKDQDTGENVKTEVVAGIGAEIFNDYVSNIASGDYSHAEGDGTTASGISSHAEGDGTTASGSESHAEGDGTTASGISSHAEGAGTVASHCYAHAEGVDTKATGWAAHAEGCRTVAAGRCQHVQGEFNIKDTENRYVHIVGNGGDNGKDYSNAHTLDWDGNAWFAGKVFVGGTSQDDENAKTLATTPDWNVNDETNPSYIANRPFYTTDPQPHDILNGAVTFTIADEGIEMNMAGSDPLFEDNKFTEGQEVKVVWDGTEYNCIAKNNEIFGIIIGNGSVFNDFISSLDPSFVIEDTGEPFCISDNYLYTSDTTSTEHNVVVTIEESVDITIPSKYLNLNVWTGEGPGSTIVGSEDNISSGIYSYAEGDGTTASGEGSHAEGSSTKAIGMYSHAEGSYTKASGQYSHAEGGSKEASGMYSHAEGNDTTASGESSHAEGEYTTASGFAAHAEGRRTLAYGAYSHTEGFSTVARRQATNVIGRYNIDEEIETIYTDKATNTILDFRLQEETVHTYYMADSYTFDQTTGKYTLIDPVTVVGSEVLDGKYIHSTVINIGQADTIGRVKVNTNNTYSLKIYAEHYSEQYGRYVHIVGNGDQYTGNSNAHTLDWEGNAEYQGDVIAYGCESGKTPISLAELDKTKTMIVTITQEETETASEDPEVAPLNDSIPFVADKTFDEIYQHVTNGGYALVKNITDSGYYGPGIPTYYNLEAIAESEILFSYTYIGTPMNTYAGVSNNSIFKSLVVITNDNEIMRFEQTYDPTQTEEDELNTTDRTVVGAINELLATITDLQADIETLKNNQATYDEETENLTIGG